MQEKVAELLRTVLLNKHQPFDIAFPVAEIHGIKIPQIYKQAIEDLVYGKLWREATDNEIQGLAANGTWEECIRPDEANLVSTKWVFLVKLKLDGSIERFKARLVARGFSQIYGTDYTETFAPTVRMDTFRLFILIDIFCFCYMSMISLPLPKQMTNSNGPMKLLARALLPIT
jgi:hypothetical protein